MAQTPAYLTHEEQVHIVTQRKHLPGVAQPNKSRINKRVERQEKSRKVPTMVKALTFKGDKKTKKRKQQDRDNNDNEGDNPRPEQQQKQLSAAADAGGGGDAASTTADSDDQNWVSADVTGDLVGPVVIVLPSSPPTCLACDANGKVFASGVENMVEGDPGTAEPHDVRQVWVATRVAGSDGVNFKGHHGR